MGHHRRRRHVSFAASSTSPRASSSDLSIVHSASVFPYILLGLALLIALGFEFVNGFHDTANAVATVIYTHSLEPHIAVVYSGILNFIGVLLSSGAVAYSDHHPAARRTDPQGQQRRRLRHGLRPAHRRHPLEPRHLVAGLPASSSHTMIGSIIGVGIANQLMHGQLRRQRRRLGAGHQGLHSALLVRRSSASSCRAALFFLFKLVARDPRLYKAPEGTAPPPF